MELRDGRYVSHQVAGQLGAPRVGGVSDLGGRLVAHGETGSLVLESDGRHLVEASSPVHFAEVARLKQPMASNATRRGRRQARLAASKIPGRSTIIGDMRRAVGNRGAALLCFVSDSEEFVQSALGRGGVRRARADLEPLSSIEPYLVALKLPEASVSREARRALEPRLAHVGVASLHELVVDQALPPHTRRNALSLAKGKSKWERLPVLLDGCGDPDEMIANMALLLVDGWCTGYNRSSLQPTPAQVEAASASFARISRRLSAHARTEVGHIVSVLGRPSTT